MFQHLMFNQKTLHLNLRHSSFWNPPISVQFSHCQSLIFVDGSPYAFNILRCSTCYRPSRMWVTANGFLAIFEAFLPHFYLHCTHCIIPKAFQIIQIVSAEKCSSLTQNLMQICCSIQSVILNVMATLCTCSLNSVYHPH